MLACWLNEHTSANLLHGSPVYACLMTLKRHETLETHVATAHIPAYTCAGPVMPEFTVFNNQFMYLLLLVLQVCLQRKPLPALRVTLRRLKRLNSIRCSAPAF